MMLESYWILLRRPAWARFFVSALVARIGISMSGLGIIWTISAGTSSYQLAGLCTGAFSTAEAILGPVLARIIDHRGQPAVLRWTIPLHALAATGLVVLSIRGAGPLLLESVAVAMGMTIPQFGALSAARWSWVLGGDPVTLRSAYALEAGANDVAFLVGPAIVSMASAWRYGFAGTLLALALLVTGGTTFLLSRSTIPPVASSSARGEPVSLGSHWVRVIALLVFVNLVFGVFFGSTQVSVTALSIGLGHGALGGVLYGFMSVAGIVSGLIYGRSHWKLSRMRQLAVMLTVLFSGCFLLAASNQIITLTLALLVCGVAIAPTLVICNLLIQHCVPSPHLTQAFTVQNSFSAAGVALGAALAGTLIDAGANNGGFLVTAAILAIVALVVLLVGPRVEPKLSVDL